MPSFSILLQLCFLTEFNSPLVSSLIYTYFHFKFSSDFYFLITNFFSSRPHAPILINFQNKMIRVKSFILDLFLYSSHRPRTFWRHLTQWVSSRHILTSPNERCGWFFLLFCIFLIRESQLVGPSVQRSGETVMY